MLDDILNSISNFFAQYEAALIWFVIILMLLIIFKKYQKGELNGKYVKTNKGEKFLIKTKKDRLTKIELYFLIFMSFIFLVVALVSLYHADYGYFFSSIGLLINLILEFTFKVPSLQIDINLNDINLNGKKFKRHQIHQIQIWDELIAIKTTKNKEKEVKIDYTEKSFDLVLQMIKSLKVFASLNQVEIIDKFEYDISQNEMLVKK